MNTKIAGYNLYQTMYSVDLWQLRNVLKDELNKKTSFDFLSEENENLRANIEALLSMEIAGWAMYAPPSIDERKAFISQLFHDGFPIHIIYGGEHSLLKQAVDKDNLDMFECLIQCCEKSIEPNRDCEFLLEQILESKNKNRFIPVLLKINNPKIIKINLNTKNASNMTPLMRAAENNDAWLEPLMIAGALLEEVNEAGETALLIAARAGNLDAVKLLIKYGANIKASSTNGSNLCSIAYDNKQDAPDLLNYLIENKMEATFDDFNGLPILIHAIKEAYDLSTVKLLITKNRVNQPCPRTGNTPLITAYLSEYDCYDEFNDDLVDLLLSHGADPSVKNKKEQTAISIVQQRYDDLDDEDAENYNDSIEKEVNKLAFKSCDLYIAEDAMLEDEPEHYEAKIKLKSSARDVLEDVANYISRDYKKAKKKLAALQFEICDIYNIRFVQGINDDFESVIAQFERFTQKHMESYKKAQFEIASLLIHVSANHEDGTEERRTFLIRALNHADRSQDESLSNQILSSLCGRTIRDGLAPLPTDNYERLSYFSEAVKDYEKEISTLKQQLALKQSSVSVASSSSLIRKRSDSPIFSADSAESAEPKDNDAHVAKKNKSTHG